ncbi:MAG: glycosyltransferase family 9 protein [Deltaproteobacteria bacterium]|nr:glycosyltransferase family 9 protein [Deltaproteobacteria bacterium]
MSTKTKILVVRTDYLGDVLLSLPALSLLRQTDPEAEIDFFCREEFVDLISPFASERKIRTVQFCDNRVAPLAKTLVGQGYSAALLLKASARMALACWRASIRVRVGLYSKPWSFLTLNKGIRQHRWKAEKNEACYNIELAQCLLDRLGAGSSLVPVEKIRLKQNLKASEQATAVLAQLDIGKGSDFYVCHPGMRGSAINLSAESYARLMNRLTAEGLTVLLSIGPSDCDKKIVESIQARCSVKVLPMVGLPVLAEIFRLSRAVIGPSTGPLHLAHYVGTRAFGFYSPVTTQRAERWAPWGGAGEVEIFSPEYSCPAVRGCFGQRCTYFSCMDHMSFDNLVSRIKYRGATSGL